MGTTCNLKSETCGSKCTGYDGTAAQEIIIRKGENLWNGMARAIEKGVWCDTCREDGSKRFSGLHDTVTLSLGEEAFDSKNFNEFADWVDCTRNACRKDGRC